MLAILIIFPWRCLTIDWAASFESKKQALRSVSITLSQSSKEAFAIEALRRYFERWRQKISPIVNDPKINAVKKLRALVAAAADGAQETSYSFGCMIGNLSAELSSDHDSVRLAISEIFRDWALTFETVIEAGQKAGDLSAALQPAQAARFVVNGLQGALLRCKVDRVSTALDDLEEVIFGLLLPNNKGITGGATPRRVQVKRQRKR
jgi:TetR/AcrR family transcriptional regulator, transcriptional repressor for nem operon